MIMLDPFSSILFVAAAIAMLFVIARARVNRIGDGKFDNPSYQLGIVFGAVAWMFAAGVVSTLVWIVS